MVTAQKFEQKLIETPLSVTAISARNLEALGATRFRDFASTVPSLTFTTGGVGSTQVNLRGITTGNNISPTVGIYVDEVLWLEHAVRIGCQLALDVGLFECRGSRSCAARKARCTARARWRPAQVVSVLPDVSAFGATARAGVVNTRVAASATMPPLRSMLRSPTTRPRSA